MATPEPDADFVEALCGLVNGIGEALARIAQVDGHTRTRFALMVLDDEPGAALPLYIAGTHGAIPDIVDIVRNKASNFDHNMIN